MATLNNSNDDDVILDHDQAAMQLAINQILAGSDTDTIEQIKTMLKVNPLDEVRSYASYHCQHEALRTAPWQPAPCDIGDPDVVLAIPQREGDGQHEAALLLKKMLALGV